MDAPVTKQLAIIILSWDCIQDTLACLQSTRQSDYPNSEILVVDNANQSELAATLSRDYPEVHLIQNTTNLGYTGGNNRGIRWAVEHGAEFILLLNDDIQIEPKTCRFLVETSLRYPDVAAVGGKIRPVGQPSYLWSAGETFPREMPLVCDDGQFDTHKIVRYTAGGCILLSRAALEEVGVLDEAFFMIHEEKEWCYRASQAGWMTWFTPRAIAWHNLKDSFSNCWSPNYHYFYVRNNLYFWQKYTTRNLGLKQKHSQAYAYTWQELVFIRRHGDQRIRRARAAIRGMRDYLAGRFGPSPEGL